MNQNQKQFLNDLDHLLNKYMVTHVKTGGSGEIRFYSQGQVVAFEEYAQRAFRRVSTEQDAYNPPMPELSKEATCNA